MSDRGIGENGCLCRSKNLADTFPIYSFFLIVSFHFSFPFVFLL